MVTMRQVEAFKAVMMTGMVTQAAALLSVSQPAVSRMIADLEQEIGFKLFVRANRQLTPTEEGRRFYDEVERAFIGLDQIAKTAAEIRDYRRGHFRLITIPSLASTVMADLIARFVRRYPDISVSLEVQPSQRVFEWIVSQQCDIGLSTLPVENVAISSRPVLSCNAVCIMPEGHRLARRTRVAPRDLAGESFISFKSDSIFRHLVDEAFQSAGVRRDLRIEARTMAAIYGLVGAGLGVSVIGPALSPKALHPGVVMRRFEPAIAIQLALIYPAHKALSQVSQRFIEIVDDYAGSSPGETPAMQTKMTG